MGKFIFTTKTQRARSSESGSVEVFSYLRVLRALRGESFLSAFSFRLGESPHLKDLLHQFFRARGGVPVGDFELPPHLFYLPADLAFRMEDTLPARAQIFNSLGGDPAGHEQRGVGIGSALQRVEQNFPRCHDGSLGENKSHRKIRFSQRRSIVRPMARRT